MAEMREAKAPEKSKEPKAKLHHLRIHPHKGGHLVTHHAHHPLGGHDEHPYATHVFGKGDGEKLMSHIMKHGKIEKPTEPAEAAENEPEGGEATEEAQEGE